MVEPEVTADWRLWEGVARDVLEDTCTSVPVSAYSLAMALDVVVEPWSGHGAKLDRVRRVIQVSPRARLVRRHGLIAHELGHLLLGEEGCDSDDGAQYMAGALMVPGVELSRDLRVDWSIERLRRIHAHASAHMLAHRIVQLRQRDAVAAIVDAGKLRFRIASPWLPRPVQGRMQVLTRFERDLVERALEAGCEIREGLSCAYPVFDGPHRRVVVVSELEQLSLRL